MMGKGSILFVSKRRDAASTRYRVFQYWDYLAAQGWELAYLPAGAGRLRLLRQAARADIVVIQRKLFDWPTLAALKRVNRNIVFDFDDAIFLNDDGSPSRRRRRRFERSTRAARLALAGNRYLAAQARSPRTVLFPTTVEVDRYPPVSAPPRAAGEALSLVWIGSRSTAKYLEEARDCLEAIGRTVPNVELKVIGDFEIHFEHLPTRCIAWSAQTEVAELTSAHVGIAPMVDDAWTRGKCALKVIQYMACGLPVVSSRCGANAEIVVDGETGFLVKGAAAWVAAVDRLRDERERQRMGRAARRRAEEDYSAEQLARRMDALFANLLAD